MKSFPFLLLFFFLCSGSHAQHTFSIVAIDTATLEIGSAGATCLDVNREGLAAVVISDILPGRGVVHSQALLNFSNQTNARIRMQAGDTPEQIISWLRNNDVQRNPEVRQYGIVAIDPAGRVETAAFTGRNCLDVKDHILGPNYSIQGNILMGTQVLDSMEGAFLRQEGPLADKLMAALNAAAFPGADSRCFNEGVSSRSAFIRLAQADDPPNRLTVDLSVNATPRGIEPIDELYIQYLKFKATKVEGAEKFDIKVFPNPFFNAVKIEAPYSSDWTATFLDNSGKKCLSIRWTGSEKLVENIRLDASTIVLLQLKDERRDDVVFSKKLIARGR